MGWDGRDLEPNGTATEQYLRIKQLREAIASTLQNSKFASFFFFFSDAKFRPAATHALAHTTKEVGGRSSPGPADAVGTVRLMLFLPDDAPSPSQAN